jgi:TatD DNase family protein
MIDSHAHLDDRQFDADREEVIRRSFENGVEKIVNIGAGLGSSERSVQLAEKYENIFASVGCHPDYFMKHGTWSMEHKTKLEKLAKHKKVVAIGEIGLDYFNQGREMTEKDEKFQKEGFIFQLELARLLGKPVVIHCRGKQAESGKNYREEVSAYEDVLSVIEKFPDLKFVFHSFGGRLEFAKKILKKENMSFSFAGNITYNKPSSEINEAIRLIPLEKIMLDSDCPYLAPVPMRGKRNEPEYVKYVAEKIGEIKKISSKEVISQTALNAKSYFNFSKY